MPAELQSHLNMARVAAAPTSIAAPANTAPSMQACLLATLPPTSCAKQVGGPVLMLKLIFDVAAALPSDANGADAAGSVALPVSRRPIAPSEFSTPPVTVRLRKLRGDGSGCQ